MLSLPLPMIDQIRCTGCGRCVETCPTQALAQVNSKAHLHDPDLCTYCALCESICPVDAIALPFLVVLAKADPSTQKTTQKTSTGASGYAN